MFLKKGGIFLNIFIKYGLSIFIYFTIYYTFLNFSGFKKAISSKDRIDNLVHLSVGDKYYELKFHLIYMFVSLFLLKEVSLQQFFLNQIFISFLLLISLIDIKTQFIPDKVSIPAVLILITYKFFFLSSQLKDSFLGLLVGAVITIILIIVTFGGFGGGDWRLNALIGFGLGYNLLTNALILGSFIGGVFTLSLVTNKIVRIGDRTCVPYGQFFCMGAIFTMLTNL